MVKVLPVLPSSLEERVGLSASERQKWVSILLAVFGASQVISHIFWGCIADRPGYRKPIFLFGSIALAAATTLSYIGDSLALLLVGRAAQGVSTAVVLTVGIPLIVDKAPVDQLGSALGIIGTSIATAIVVGPIIGGFSYRYAGYHSVFAISYCLLAIQAILTLLLKEGEASISHTHTKGQHGDLMRSDQQDFDEGRYCTFPRSGGASSPSWSTSTSRDDLPKSDKSRARDWIPGILWLLVSPRIWICVAACFVNATLLASFESVVPLFVAETFDWNSDQQGLIFLTLCGGFFLCPLIGRLADRCGTRSVTSAGFLLCAPMFMALQLVHYHSREQEALLCVLLVMIGFSIALVHASTMLEINLSVQAETALRPERFGEGGATAQANSLRNCAIAGGITIGPLLSGFLRDQYGWRTMSMTLGFVSAVAALATFLWLGGTVRFLKKSASTPRNCEA